MTRSTPPRESAITRDVLRALRSRGGRWVKLHGHRMQDATLDIIGCYRGRYVELEVKRPGKKPTPRQAVIAQLVEHAQGVTAVVRCRDDALVVLDHIESATPGDAQHDPGRGRS